MGQILIVQDSGEVGLVLDQHSIVRANGVEDLRRALQAQRYEAAVVVQKSEADSAFEILHAADPDLAVVVIAADEAMARPQRPDAEVLIVPFAQESLGSAVQRAIRRTQLEREVKNLRVQVGGASRTDGADGNGSAAEHLAWIRSLPPRFDLRDLLSSVEKTVIVRTLEATKGAQAEAARRLGLSRSDLSYKLAKYELRKTASDRAAEQN